MTRSALLSIVAASLLATVAFAAVRPRYGGILRLTTGVAPVSIDPANSTIDTLATRNIYRLMFDTLVVLDTRGKPQPALATSWQAEPGDQRWHFQLRSGLTFQDGTAIGRSEEHTSELQSRFDLVCRLLLEKKKKKT